MLLGTLQAHGIGMVQTTSGTTPPIIYVPIASDDPSPIKDTPVAVDPIYMNPDIGTFNNPSSSLPDPTTQDTSAYAWLDNWNIPGLSSGSSSDSGQTLFMFVATAFVLYLFFGQDSGGGGGRRRR